MSQASDAMKMAADTGMTLKEAWAEVKKGGGGKSAPPGMEERGKHTLASLRARSEAW